MVKKVLFILLEAVLISFLIGYGLFLFKVMIDAYSTHDFSCGNSGFYEDSDC